MHGTVDKRLIVAAVLLAWLVFLAFQILRHLGGGMPGQPALSFFAPFGAKINRARQIDEALSTGFFSAFKPAKNTSNPFYSNPVLPPPPPEPPTTKQVDLLYQGFFVTSQGDKKAYVMVADQLIIGAVGAKVAGNYTMAGISPSVLLLKDPAGKELALSFNVKKPIVVPIK